MPLDDLSVVGLLAVDLAPLVHLVKTALSVGACLLRVVLVRDSGLCQTVRNPDTGLLAITTHSGHERPICVEMLYVSTIAFAEWLRAPTFPGLAGIASGREIYDDTSGSGGKKGVLRENEPTIQAFYMVSGSHRRRCDEAPFTRFP